MNTPNQITYFDAFEGPNPYDFLSNFYVGRPILHREIYYATGEHMFQAFKATTLDEHMEIVAALGPGAAKSLGRSIDLRPDWELVKYDVMRLVLARKFDLTRPEAKMLLKTGDALLVEGTDWNDKVWGVARTKKTPHRGRNWLGTLLMARRAELRAIQSGAKVPPLDAISRFACNV